MKPPIELLENRKTLQAELKRVMRSSKAGTAGSWGKDAKGRLLEFMLAGKGVRGSLAMFSYQVFSGKDFKEALSLATALEFFHAAFLIQDDIMDKDNFRRGKPSIHKQYKKEGVSMAICVSDFALFLGFDQLSKVRSSSSLVQQACRELSYTAVAQMHDIYPVGKQTFASLLQTYRFKTARYTFSLPLSAGAILAGKSIRVVKDLEKLGEDIGILFQMRDDELDEGENKKVLASFLNPGNLKKMKSKYANSANKRISKLGISKANKQVLNDLAQFVLLRDH